MSRAKAIRQSQIKPPVYRVKDNYVIRLLNSWVIQNEKLADFTALPPNKQEARKFFEDQMRIAICIAKNKPEITAKPRKPEKPYKGFYEFVHQMRLAAVDRGFNYLFARKLKNGSKVPMIDGNYEVHNLHLNEDNSGELDLVRDDLVYHIKWNQNVPKFYYRKGMDMQPEHMKEGLNKNSSELDKLYSSLAMIKSSIENMEQMGIDCSAMHEQVADIEAEIKAKEGK